jgi:uncharacterized membrane protein YqjE
MPVNGNGSPRRLTTLLRDLAEGGIELVKHEARLTSIELGTLVRRVGTASGLVAIGGVLVLVGALAVLTGIIMLFADQWVHDRYWLAALIVFAMTATASLWLARHASAFLSTKELAPDETLATLKEDRTWLKRQLKSDATSS